MNICTKYGFDILIISGSYGGHRRHTTYDGRQTTDDGRRTTPRVWHKLPTGELKTLNFRDEGLAAEKAGGRPGPRKLKGSRQAGMDSSPLLPPFFAE